jgi:Flp pilus assembly protein CpaB
MSDYTPPGYGPAPVATSGGKRGKGKNPTKRSASTLKWLFLAFAAVAGLLVVVAVTRGSSVTYVVRAATAMPAMVEVTEANVEAVPLAKDAIEPDTFSAKSAEAAIASFLEFSAGKWLVYPAGAGQQLRTGNFSAFGELAVPLAPDERLVSISAKAANSVAGGVRPGDRIDLYVATGSDGLTGLLGADVDVVAVSILPEQFDSAAASQIDDPSITLADVVPAEPIPGTYILRVNAADVARYVAADTAGRIYIALRARDGVDAPAQNPVDLLRSLCTLSSVSVSCGTQVTPLPDGTDVTVDPVTGATLPPVDPAAVPSSSPSASAQPVVPSPSPSS